jgi:hypothetical protein
MNITIRLTTQYGAQVIVPVCNTARQLAELAGTKNLTAQAVKMIKALGYVVNVEQTIPLTL